MDVAADLVWGWLSESFAVTVKLKVPLAVGVPERMPVADARVRPAGRLPEVTDQVYAGTPPVALNELL
jgi:hypothetical protein